MKELLKDMAEEIMQVEAEAARMREVFYHMQGWIRDKRFKSVDEAVFVAAWLQTYPDIPIKEGYVEAVQQYKEREGL